MIKAVLVFTVCLIVLVGVVALTSSSAYTPDSWTLKFDNDRVTGVMDTNAIFLSLLNCNGKYYAVSGGSSPGRGIITYYDSNTDKWAIANNSVIGPSEAATVCGNKIYTFSWSTLQEYDPARQSLEQKASPPSPILGPEIYALDGKIYFFGSALISNAQVTWIYDPVADSWSESPLRMPSYSYHTATVLDNKLYLVGTNVFGSSVNTSFMIFSPQTGNWSQGTPLPYTVVGRSSCATSGVKAPKMLYVVGDLYMSDGYSQPRPTGQVLQIYNPQTKAWSNGTSPPSNVTVNTITSVDDQLYAYCKSNKPVNFILSYEQVYVYTPQGYGVKTPTPTPPPQTQNPTVANSSPSSSSSLPSSSIPEFQSWFILPIMLIIAMALAGISAHRRH